MKLNEAEMRMAYQIESTDPNAVLNEIYMTWRLSRNQATRDTAESLMAKLRSLSNSFTPSSDSRLDMVLDIAG